LEGELTTLHYKKSLYYEMLYMALESAVFFGMNWAVEEGLEIWI
jgi:hypothetical protein